MKNEKKLFRALVLVIFLLVIFVTLQSMPEAEAAGTVGTPTIMAQVVHTATPAADGSVTHVVMEGQVLITIAQSYGISLSDLLALNNLKETDIIRPGDVLTIKKVSAAAAPTSNPVADAQTATAQSLALTPTALAATPDGERTAQALADANTLQTTSAKSTETASKAPNILARVFSDNTKYLGLGIILLVLLGLLLLVISSRRIRQ